MQFFFPILDQVGVWILVSLFGFLFLMETFFQLRKRVQPRLKRIFINSGMGVVGLIALRLTLIPVMVWAASLAQQHEIGLLNWLELPGWAAFVLAFFMLDYLNYWWHFLNHQIPVFWRFHNVHHTDLDLDVTTAIRFHFGEVLASVIFRGLVILAIGASPVLVLIYEIVFEAATDFHHTNWRLKRSFEKVLQYFMVTPRMHGIHHSVIKKETDSNFGVIFSFWDRLHKTLIAGIRQKNIVIGVPPYRNPAELTFLKLLLMPFKKQRE